MKKIILFFLVSICVATMAAHNMKQQGVTYRYNGKNPRTPIGGVYIKPITASNGEVSDDNNGTFTLVLSNLKMGDRIGNVRVTKQGMMVFNQQAVDEWSIRKEPLCLILCNADEFQKQKENLIDIGRNEAKKKYDRRLAELKKQNDAQQLKIDEYYNRLDSLEKEYQNSLKHMDEYADVFARIDESEVDSIAQRAIELFNRGEIEESIYMLEQQNYIEKIKQANRTIEHADALISEAGHAKMLAEEDKKKYIEGIRTQIAGYKLKNEWEKAKELLKGLADNLNTLEAIWDYASFCYNQNDFNEAEAYYLKYYERLCAIIDLDELERNSSLARFKHNLAMVYIKTQRYSEGEALYKEALLIRERLAAVNPSAYEPDLANTQNNLAVVYNDTHRFSESESMHKAALEIRERLVAANPSAYEPYLLVTKHNLADLYSDTYRFSESEKMYKEELSIIERLAKVNLSVYEPSLAAAHNNLAVLYMHAQLYDESEVMYKSALTIRERLAKANPSAYEPELAVTQNNIAILYMNTQRYDESEVMYKAALAIRERLAKANPSAYEPDLAVTQNNIAGLYKDMKRYDESETMYKAALLIRERLSTVNPSAYEPDLATTQNNIATVYYDLQRYTECEEMYEAALTIRKRLAKANPSAYEPDLAITLNNLAILYSHTKRYTESEEMYKAALEIYMRFAKSNPSTFEPFVSSIRYNLADLYGDLQRYTESEAMYKAALSIRERLAKSNPSAYEPDLASTQKNLAIYYFNMKRYEESEVMYRASVMTCQHLYENNPQLYIMKLLDCYFGLGRTLSIMGRDNEAKEPYKQALLLARQMVKAGNNTVLYMISLYVLSKISSSERDYASSYEYNVELLPLTKDRYLADSAKWKEDYVGIIVDLSFYSNMTGRFKEGEKYSLDALKVDSTQTIVRANLAAAQLLQGKMEDAEEIYQHYKSDLKDRFLEDFAEFERLGIIPEERKTDVERVKAILKN